MTYQLVTIVGNVGRDAEVRYTPQGIAVADFSVAVSKVTGRGEDKKEKTTWFKVSVWREQAEVAGNYVKKGMKILVTGEVEARAYMDKNNQPQASLELTAREFKFLSSRGEMEGGGAEPSYAPAGNSKGARAGNQTQGGGYEDPDDIPF